MRAFLCAHPIIDDFEINWKEFDANSKLMDTTLCPTNQVPVLYLANLQKPIVETFAIAEVLSELGGLSWPKDRSDRCMQKVFAWSFKTKQTN